MSARGQPDPQWWREAVFYQVYLRSLQDSDGDGVGDLEGLRRRLPHLAGLGVDVLWLSPVHPSPNKDFGYDVADYCGIDPGLGDLEAFDRLLGEADALGMRIILDLVVNHTSDQHAWFQESRRGPDNPYRDWYLWRDPAPGGGPPNNWTSVFGGPAWSRDGHQWYLHLFLPEQPDLNWRNPAVEAAIHDAMRFWLRRGVAGFRLDVYNCYRKHPQLADNPRTWNPGGLIYGYLGQRHVNDQDQPDLVEVLHGMRQVVDAHAGVLVGETLAANDYAAAGRYSGPHALHLAFHFALLRSRWRAADVFDAIQAQLGALGAEAWPTWVLSNHDFKRAPHRIIAAVGEARADDQLAVAAALLLTLPGTPFLYYGEEIGLREAKIPKAKLRDPVGIRFWPLPVGRDGCRTPMPWTPAGGFSDAEPWLPLQPDTATRNVELQQADPTSLLSRWRALLALRRAVPALRRGALEGLERAGERLSWRRVLEGQTVEVHLNLGARPRPLQTGGGQIAFSTRREAGPIAAGAATLAGDEALIVVR